MSDWALNTPVALIIFNRPDTTDRVFAEIAKAKPPILLVVADGPRKDQKDEAERCEAARAVINKVDWACKILTNFSAVNLGCKKRVASGISWIFDQVPEAIILEDDCLPHPTFFRFCEEMLIYFRDDKRIGMISGDNFQSVHERAHCSYYFSRYNHIWGWASWRRAWAHYDQDISTWPIARQKNLLSIVLRNPKEIIFWNKKFDQVYEGRIDTWDYQWTFALWMQSMLTVLPSVNLISNIGFGVHATHTIEHSPYADLITSPVTFPLIHPLEVLPNRSADDITFKEMYTRNRRSRIMSIVASLFHQKVR